MTPWELLITSTLGGTAGLTLEKMFEGAKWPMLLMLTAFLFFMWIVLFNIKSSPFRKAKR